ncbi:MAG: TolC family protein [Verrucomicrobiales bacterium]|nr:TolC family protein [Verrucomicrobiales bacterium]
MKPRISSLVTAWAVAGSVALATPTTTADDLVTLTPTFLAELVESARTNHPGLRAAALRTTAAQHAVSAVRLWDDPMFRFGGMVGGDPGPDLEMEGDLLYEIEQPLPLFGKATAMRKESEAGVAVAAAEESDSLQNLRRSLVQTAFQLALADETLAIGREDLVLLDRMMAFARERLAAGLDSNLNVLRLENEKARREQQQTTDTLQRDFLRTTLDRLLGGRPGSPWPAFALPDIAPFVPFTDRMIELATKYEPRLQVLRREIEMAEAGVEVARRERFPEVSLGIEGRQWSGSGGFREGAFTVGLSLPWFNRSRIRAQVDRGRAQAEALREAASDYTLSVRQELFRVWTRIDSARREALLYRDAILPRSAQAVDTAMAGWSSGRTMFTDLMEARRMLTEARLMRARAIAEQHLMITELVTCCGLGELDSLSMLLPESDASSLDAKPASAIPLRAPISR